MIYLDNAATTRIDNMVFAEMLPWLKNGYGNPSSLYSLGKEAKKAVEKARRRAAKAINAEPNQIFFVSSATEANNFVLSNFNTALCSRVEHPSIYKHPNTIKMDATSLANQIYRYMPDLVTNMFVNNETGKIYNVKEMAKISHQMNKPFHTDAVQAFGRIPVDVKELDVDSLSISGHKRHAPKGVGVLYLKEPSKYKPLLYGGGQEKGLRSSTENVAAIVGIGKACELYNYNAETAEHIYSLKAHLQSFITANIPDIRINSGEKSVPNILNVSFKGIDGESLLLLLDRQGICVSSGSACSSGSHKPSYVLKDMNVPDDYIHGSIRFSFSRQNTLDEIIKTEQILKTTIEKLRDASLSY